MTWGHMVSKDLLTWYDRPFALYPNSSYDHAGAFDGTVLTGVDYQGTPNTTLLLYTGVVAAPSWKQAYTPGQEKQILAIARPDGSFEKLGPVIPRPPAGFNVTGFRDPFLFRSNTFDALLNKKNGVYTTVSSGLHGQGPRLWLYHTENWHDWTFLGALRAADGNTTWNPKYSGYDGYNYEVASYAVLQEWHVLSYGTEGGRATHSEHWPLWSAGRKLSSPDGNPSVVQIAEEMAGVADWGLYYAGLGWHDELTGRTIMSGWILEDLLDGVTDPQGWGGMFSLNRELFIAQIKHVDRNDPHVGMKASWVATDIEKGGDTVTINTLGIRPLKEYEAMRATATHWSLSKNNNNTIPVQSATAEIIAKFSFIGTPEAFGLTIRKSPICHEETTITYEPSTEYLTVRKNASSLDTKTYNLADETGILPLFQIKKGHKTITEPLSMRIFVDNSVIEVYANDRFAMSARVYPTCKDATSMSLQVPDGVTIESLDIYYDIKFKAFPDRDA